MHQLANDKLKLENGAAILTLYIQLRQDFKLYSVFYIHFTILNVCPFKVFLQPTYKTKVI
jgi:hypothetical protein